MTRDGSYGNGLSWYPAMNIAYVQCFNIHKELNPDSPNQVSPDSPNQILQIVLVKLCHKVTWVQVYTIGNWKFY